MSFANDFRIVCVVGSAGWLDAYIKAQGMAGRDYGFSAFSDNELARKTHRSHCLWI